MPKRPKTDIFPLLGRDALAALDLLSAPIHAYSFASQRICWANRAGLAIWRAESLDELRGRQLAPFSAATANRLAAFHRAFSAGETRLESWTLYPRGEAITTLCHLRGVSLAGHPEVMLVEHREVTTAELPDAELRAIEALRHTPMFVSLHATDGAVLMRNPAARAGMRDDGAGDANRLVAMFADHDQAQRLLDAAARDGMAQGIAEMAFAGHPHHLVQVVSTRDPATGQQAFLLTQQDVTETIETRRKLAESEEALNLVLDLNPSAAVVVSVATGRLLRTNSAARALLGQGGDEDSADGFDLFAEARDFEALVAEVAMPGRDTWQCRINRGVGGDFRALVSASALSYGGMDALVLVLTDIDPFYRVASELEAALDIERQSNARQRKALAVTSHEMRTPLAIIDSSAQRIERALREGALEQLDGVAGRIRATVRRLLHLFDGAIERSADGPVAADPALARDDLAAIVEANALAMREVYPALQVRIDLPRLPDLLLNRVRLDMVFSNLFSNAIKYSTGAPEVAITGFIGHDCVMIDFADRGMGIPPAEWGSVFGEDTRGSNVGSLPGRGLGLSIVQQIMRQHGGAAHIVGVPAEGTCIRLTFPLAT